MRTYDRIEGLGCGFRQLSSIYVVLVFSHHMPIPRQPLLLAFLFDLSHFRCLLVPSFLIFSSFVTPHIHRSIRISATSSINSYTYNKLLVKKPWVHGLNKSRVPSHNGGTIYRVAIKRLICRRAVAPSFTQRNVSITQFHQSRSVNIALVAKCHIIIFS